MRTNLEAVEEEWRLSDVEKRMRLLFSGFEPQPVLVQREPPQRGTCLFPSKALQAGEGTAYARAIDLSPDMFTPFEPPKVIIPPNMPNKQPPPPQPQQLAKPQQVMGGAEGVRQPAQSFGALVQPAPTVMTHSNSSTTHESTPDYHDISTQMAYTPQIPVSYPQQQQQQQGPSFSFRQPQPQPAPLTFQRSSSFTPQQPPAPTSSVSLRAPPLPINSFHPQPPPPPPPAFVPMAAAVAHTPNSNFTAPARISPPHNNNAPQPAQNQVLAPPTSNAAIMEIEDMLEAETSQTMDWQELYRLNRAVFGHDRFRAGQRTAVNATLSGLDCFILLPTGGGKSLCYQLPAVYSVGKCTVVISPLVSLVHDQVSALRACGVRASALFGHDRDLDNTNQETMSALFAHDATNLPSLLYVTPEKLAQSGGLLNALDALDRRGRLRAFTIDEAHCVSQWGHDFRQDYLKLGVLRERYPHVPILALTATANALVMEDTFRLLRLNANCVTVKLSFDRPNLRYSVLRKTSQAKALEELVHLIRSRPTPNESGIVYCLTRSECEKVSQHLEEELGKGKALYYHAGIEDPRERQARQDLWARDEVPIVCATIAFGMGIDKPHVRFVVHFSLPKSLVNFYQESGRGGRDGLDTDCTVFYSYADKLRIEKMIKMENTDNAMAAVPNADRQIHQQLVNLGRMVQFCENDTDCRRTLILEYFGESFHKQQCKQTCDNCQATAQCELERVNVMPIAQELTSIVAQQQQQAAITEAALLKQCVPVLKISFFAQHRNLVQNERFQRDMASRVLHGLICSNHLVENERQNRAGYSTVYIQLGSQRLLGNEDLHVMVRTRMKRRTNVAAGASTISTPPPPPRRKQAATAAAAKPAPPSTLPLPLPPPPPQEVVYLDDDDEGEEEDDGDPFEADVAVAPSSQKKEPASAAPTTASRLTKSQQAELVNLLRESSKQIMVEEKISRFWLVYKDSSLLEIADRVPTTLEQLADISEVSQEKVAKFGFKTLAVIYQFLASKVPGFDSSAFVWKSKPGGENAKRAKVM